MKPSITLNEQENTLRRLLLDVAQHAAVSSGNRAPQLRFTGGWVRDKLLGSTSHDIDIGIDNMTGSQFSFWLKQYLALDESRTKYPEGVLGSMATIGSNPERSKHLETVTTRILGLDIDLVNLRKESYTEHSRNPSMEFGTPEEDALRRDATVNALFYNLSTEEVEDLTGNGMRDLGRRVIKTPLSPLQTFKDDPLRILRAIRFASRLNFRLDQDDISAMKDCSIKNILRLKISRERIGTELVKMLKGPNPYVGLSLLDNIGLYGTIFTDMQDREFKHHTVGLWAKAYSTLQKITTANSGQQNELLTPLSKVNSILIRDSDDLFLAWMLACFTPYARMLPTPLPTATKRPPFPACVAAKEGIKADNKITKVVSDAVQSLQDIIALKNAVTQAKPQVTSPLRRKSSLVGRDTQGMAIRRWGVHWRTCVLFALLTEVSEDCSEHSMGDIIKQYAVWLAEIEDLDLLRAGDLKLMVSGKQLMILVGSKQSGPWIKSALDIILAWQFRHPDATDPAGAIGEVMSRKDQLGIP